MFFFFQAEDGIRDIGVTGVQTCALPIFTSCGCTSAFGGNIAPGGSGYNAAWEMRVLTRGIVLRIVYHVPDAKGNPMSDEIGRASCRGKSVDLGGRRIIKKKKERVFKGDL